jgi:hypothetical protein
MPDKMLLLGAAGLSAVTAAAVLLLCAWSWRTPHPARAAAGSVLGVGLGFFAGCWLLLRRLPPWPPGEDQDRWLYILWPAVVVVELAAAIPRLPHWLAWLLRAVVAAGAARVLLDNTTYLADLPGGQRDWTPAQAWLILGGLAAALLALWALLALLTRRTRGRAVPLTVAVSCAGAAVAVMLSSYATGGQLGMPLAGALTGAMLASLVLPAADAQPAVHGALGLGVVGLFALLIMGCFSGELSPGLAALLFFGPLVGWATEAPPRFRGLVRVALVALPVALALALAQQKFEADSKTDASGSQEPTAQDYNDFGK